MSVADKTRIALVANAEGIASVTGKLFTALPTDTSADPTVTRALDTATRINSAGNIETVVANKGRISYELGVDQCPNLLVERLRINYAPYSQNLSTNWSSYAATIVGGQTDIHGQLNAVLVYPTVSGAAYGQIYSNTPASPTIGTVVCHSWEVRYAGKQWVYVGIVDGTSGAAAAYFDILNGVVGTITAGYTAGMYPEGTGYVIWVSKATTSTGNYPLCAACDADGSNVNTISGTNGIICSNPQFEVGTFPSSRIITGASAVTANADVILKAGIGSLLNGAKGLFVDCYLQAGSLSDGVYREVAELYTNSTNRVYFYRYNNSVYFTVENTTVQCDLLAAITTPFKNKRIKY
jgi:hypothetical protein